MRELRSHSRAPSATFTKPSPSWPKRFSRGTLQSSNTSSEVGEARQPIFLRGFPGLNPSKPFSTMKADMPRAFLEGSVEAMTTSTSAMGPLVMNILAPFKT